MSRKAAVKHSYTSIVVVCRGGVETQLFRDPLEWRQITKARVRNNPTSCLEAVTKTIAVLSPNVKADWDMGFAKIKVLDNYTQVIEEYDIIRYRHDTIIRENRVCH